jgi:GNAT superfamily N-acetyltransferase
MTTGQLTITCAARRPDLVPVVSGWLWREWWQDRGLSADATRALYSKGQVEVGAPQTLILLADDVAVGTASLALHDLEERPDLSPWLAGVFVIPEMRGRGCARRLLAAFDEVCCAATIKTAWLYTTSAGGLYLKAGWRVAQTVERPGRRPVTLMRREFVKPHSN